MKKEFKTKNNVVQMNKEKIKEKAQISLDDIKRHGKLLEYVKVQTPEMCLEAVKQNGLALEFVEEQTPEICLEAVKQNGKALEFVEEQTEEMCLEAIKQNYKNAKYIDVSDSELESRIYKKAIDIEPDVFRYIYTEDIDVILLAVSEHAKLFKHVDEQTHELCKLAFDKNPDVFKYCDFQTIDMCIKACMYDYKNINYIKNIRMVEQVYKYIKENCTKIKDIALTGDDGVVPVLFEDGSVTYYDEEDKGLVGNVASEFTTPEIRNIYNRVMDNGLRLVKDYKISHVCTPSARFLAITEDNLIVSSYCEGTFKLPDIKVIKAIDIMVSIDNTEDDDDDDHTTLFVLGENKILYRYEINTEHELEVKLAEEIEGVNNIINDENGFIIEKDNEAIIYYMGQYLCTLNKNNNEKVRYYYNYGEFLLVSDNTIKKHNISNNDDNGIILKTDCPIEDISVCNNYMYILLNENGIYKTYVYECNMDDNLPAPIVKSLGLLVIHDSKPKYITAIENYQLTYLEDGILYVGDDGIIINPVKGVY